MRVAVSGRCCARPICCTRVGWRQPRFLSLRLVRFVCPSYTRCGSGVGKLCVTLRVRIISVCAVVHGPVVVLAGSTSCEGLGRLASCRISNFLVSGSLGSGGRTCKVGSLLSEVALVPCICCGAPGLGCVAGLASSGIAFGSGRASMTCKVESR